MGVGHWGCHDYLVHESWETFSCLIRKSKFPWSSIRLSYGQFREFFDTVLTSFKFFRGLFDVWVTSVWTVVCIYIYFSWTSMTFLEWDNFYWTMVKFIFMLRTEWYIPYLVNWKKNQGWHIMEDNWWIRPLILCINHHIHSQRGPGLPCSRPCEVSKAEMFFCIPIHWDLSSFILVELYFYISAQYSPILGLDSPPPSKTFTVGRWGLALVLAVL